jgi:hypothetical protein
LGNSSIQSTLVYINATIQDEAEEGTSRLYLLPVPKIEPSPAKVEAEARRSVASLVESILVCMLPQRKVYLSPDFFSQLGFLGFIPGGLTILHHLVLRLIFA